MHRCKTCVFWKASVDAEGMGVKWKQCNRVEIQGSLALAVEPSVGFSALSGNLITHETFGCTQHPENKSA